MDLDEKDKIELARKVIELLRDSGLDVSSPYDVENFATDYLCVHSNLKATGLWPYMED